MTNGDRTPRSRREGRHRARRRRTRDELPPSAGAEETTTSDEGAPEAEGTNVARAFSFTIGASAGTILLSLISGVLVARLLGPEGRGHVSAISGWTLTVSWLASLGFADSMVYMLNRKRATPPEALFATLLSIPVLGALGVVLAQLFLPWGFQAQDSNAVQMARVFLCTIPVVLGTQSAYVLLMALHRFRMLAIARVLQPLLFVVGLVILMVIDDFQARTVLAVQAASYAATMLFILVGPIREFGLKLPSLSLTKAAIGYGARSQGVSLGMLVSTRLDLMLLPAFVSAIALGYYAIAVSIASMLMSLFGSVNSVVFPVAVGKDGPEFADIVGRGLRVALVAAGAASLALGIASPVLISLVYGKEFLGAETSLLVLLPGIVLWSANSVLGAGLSAVGRPGAASVAQVVGMVVTIAGLALLLKPLGIVGAATVSSLAYSSTFFVSLWLLRRHSVFSLRQALAPHLIVSDARWVWGRLASVLGRVKGGTAT